MAHCISQLHSKLDGHGRQVGSRQRETVGSRFAQEMTRATPNIKEPLTTTRFQDVDEHAVSFGRT